MRWIVTIAFLSGIILGAASPGGSAPDAGELASATTYDGQISDSVEMGRTGSDPILRVPSSDDPNQDGDPTEDPGD